MGTPPSAAVAEGVDVFGTSIRWIPALFLAGALAQGGVLEDGHDPSIRGTFQVQAIPGPEDSAPVLDMVLDPEGNVLVAYLGDRGIWRIDLAGEVSLHALIPDGGGDILSMTLDPAGDLHVRDESALWKVTPAGEVSRAQEKETAPPCPEAPAERKLAAPVRRGGLACLALLGLGALADPSILAVSGLSSPGASSDIAAPFTRYTADAKAGLDRLDPVCAAPLLAGRAVAPCDRSYRARVLAQVDDIQGQMLERFVEPAILGPGSCLPGEPLHGAKSRLALDQSDNIVAYDALNADASALNAQLNRDGLAVAAVGQGLLTGETVAAGTGCGSTGLEAIAAFTVKEVATSLFAANQGLQAVGAIYGKVANVALVYKAKYQRYANNQTLAVLHACTSAAPVHAPAASPRAGASPAAPLASPVPALADAALKLTDGCVLASMHRLDLPVCSQESLAEVNLRNGTLGDLFQGIACLSAGVLQGRQSFCPNAPLADSRARSDTFSFFDQFFGEINAAAADSFACGNGFGVAARSVELAANAADLAGTSAEAMALNAAANGLDALGSAATADAYELTRIGFLSRRWLADVTRAFNVDSRDRLDEKEAKEKLGSRSSSTGILKLPGGLSSSASAAPARFPAVSSTGDDAGAGLWPASSTAWIGSSSTAFAEPSISAATRTRPLGLGGLALLLLPRPAPVSPREGTFGETQGTW
jgi:hypothetical protein